MNVLVEQPQMTQILNIMLSTLAIFYFLFVKIIISLSRPNMRDLPTCIPPRQCNATKQSVAIFPFRVSLLGSEWAVRAVQRQYMPVA